ncbi:MAG: hypothetical protein NUV98_05095 [Candidatus Roizmanbacteria bacterium]|nr:hypothetical protein [Candidatus Roizmanbacteria bacterium]
MKFKGTPDSSFNVLDDPYDSGPYVEAGPGELTVYEFDETIPEGSLPGEYAIAMRNPDSGFGLHAEICGPVSFYVNVAPTPTPIPPTPPPGVTYTPTPTPTPEQCPICPSDYYYAPTQNSCCKKDSSGRCLEKLEADIIICAVGEKCFQGSHCGDSPLTPTVSPDVIKLKKICEGIENLPDTTMDEHEQCIKCLDKGNAFTAFGCLPTTVEGFFKTVLFQLGLGLAGGVAFLLMLWGSFTMLISQGDPQQIQRGREIIVSAIAGLLLIIFSMVIMQFLGYNVLQIPGFNPSEGAPSDEVGSSGETGPSEPTPTPTPTPIPEELIVLPDSDFSNADIVFSPTTQNPDERISGTMTFTSQNPLSSYHTLALLVTDVSRRSENDKILQCREAPANNLSEHDLASLAIQLPPSDSPDINNLLLNVYFSKWTCADIVSNNITNVRTLSFQQNTTLQGYKRIIVNN